MVRLIVDSQPSEHMRYHLFWTHLWTWCACACACTCERACVRRHVFRHAREHRLRAKIVPPTHLGVQEHPPWPVTPFFSTPTVNAYSIRHRTCTFVEALLWRRQSNQHAASARARPQASDGSCARVSSSSSSVARSTDLSICPAKRAVFLHASQR